MINKDKIGCLIIHGFGGGRYQIKALDDYLNANGYITSSPRLEGHTGNPKDMKNADYRDWIASAEKELLLLKERTDKIVIIGFSMGGLIAVNLACKYDIKAIVTINTPIYYWNLKRVIINIYDDLKNKKFNYIKRYIEAKRACPLKSMFNFLRLLNSTKSKLPYVKCPFLIIQTKDDDTTKLESTDFIFDNISSKEKIIKLHEEGGHLVLLSQHKNKVMMDTEEFIKTII